MKAPILVHARAGHFWKGLNRMDGRNGPLRWHGLTLMRMPSAKILHKSI